VLLFVISGGGARRDDELYTARSSMSMSRLIILGCGNRGTRSSTSLYLSESSTADVGGELGGENVRLSLLNDDVSIVGATTTAGFTDIPMSDGMTSPPPPPPVLAVPVMLCSFSKAAGGDPNID